MKLRDVFPTLHETLAGILGTSPNRGTLFIRKVVLTDKSWQLLDLSHRIVVDIPLENEISYVYNNDGDMITFRVDDQYYCLTLYLLNPIVR